MASDEKVKETVTTKKRGRPKGSTNKTSSGKKKKKCKPRGGNSPVIGNNGLMLEKGDNAKIMGIQIELLNMPDIDMDDVGAVGQRLSDYFALYTERDMKPTVAGMAIALNGHNRQWLYAAAHDLPTGSSGYKAALRPEVSDLIKRAYFLLENMWETYMNSGKINPAAGIFLGKNNYAYQDTVEHVLTPNTNQEDQYSADDIRSRYSDSSSPTLIETSSDSGSDSDE